MGYRVRSYESDFSPQEILTRLSTLVRADIKVRSRPAGKRGFRLYAVSDLGKTCQVCLRCYIEPVETGSRLSVRLELPPWTRALFLYVALLFPLFTLVNFWPLEQGEWAGQTLSRVCVLVLDVAAVGAYLGCRHSMAKYGPRLLAFVEEKLLYGIDARPSPIN
ncbi:hypothetical protein [Intestinimonas sp.]|uniref:hypothetical protein n=1 Tax=Intestinimonas sp. TaxID=1965293 RepID=UPI0026168306|nr:hypothetical protein [Intestinimonas sp.]